MFANKEALGGHTSKAHPNQSSKYAQKVKRREERAPDRQILEAAKEIFNASSPGEDLRMHRSRIAVFKQKIN